MVDELLKVTKGMTPVNFPISKLVWMIEPATSVDAERVAKVDLKYPVIVHEYSPGNFATLDGYHRVVRAAQDGHQTILAIVVNDALIRKLTKQTVSKEGYFTKAEAYAAAANSKSAQLVLQAEEKRLTSECDAMGVEPNWPLPDRVARLQDIHQGSPLMFEERERRTAYASVSQGDRFKAHVDNVVKDLPPTISERQAADKFHRDLKTKLGQESFGDVSFKSISVDDPMIVKLIDESEGDRFLGDVVRGRKTKTVTGFFKGTEVVGFAVPRKDGDGRYRTGAIFVTQRFQHQGIAGAFVAQYFADKPGRAMIEPDNIKSQKLFESAGFKRSGKTIREDDGSSYEVWLKN